MILVTFVLAFLILVVCVAIGAIGLAWQPYLLVVAGRQVPDKTGSAMGAVIILILLFNLALIVLGAFPGYYAGCFDLAVSPIRALLGATP